MMRKSIEAMLRIAAGGGRLLVPSPLLVPPLPHSCCRPVGGYPNATGTCSATPLGYATGVQVENHHHTTCSLFLELALGPGNQHAMEA